MKVKTDTERVQHSRKLVMEFLASSVDVALTSPDVHRWMAEYEVDPDRFGARMDTPQGGDRDERWAGHHHDPADPTIAESRRPAGEDRQRALRPRLLALHPLLQVRRGVRRRCAEHVRDRRGRAWLRRAHLHRVRRAVERIRVRLLRELHRRLPDGRADVHVRARQARGRHVGRGRSRRSSTRSAPTAAWAASSSSTCRTTRSSRSRRPGTTT